MELSAQNVGLAVGGATAAGGIATYAALDRVIDVTGHSHRTRAWKVASWPTWGMITATGALGAATAAAYLNDDWAGAREPLLGATIGMGAGLGAAFGFRLGWGMLVSPRTARLNPGDIAGNAVDRIRMMSAEVTPIQHRIFDPVSRLQGHGSLASRADELAPMFPEGTDGMRTMMPEAWKQLRRGR